MKAIAISRCIGKVLSLLVLSGPLTCHGAVTDLASQATLIVVGGIATRVEAPETVSFDIAVDRVVKGDQHIQTVHVSHDWKRPGFVSNSSPITISAAIYGIWFLIPKDKINWDVLPLTRDGFIFSLFLPAAETLPAVYKYSLQTRFMDALVNEIGAGFESMPRTPEQMLLPRSLTGSAIQNVLRRL